MAIETPREVPRRETVEQELIGLAIPVLGTNLVALFNVSVNSMWVGRYLGDAALTAVSNANTVLVVLLTGAFGVWMAVTIRTGRYFGAGSISDAKRLIRTSIWIFGLVGVFVSIIVTLEIGPLLRVLSVPSDALPQARQYLRVILYSVPITYIYGAVIAALRGVGDTKTPFYFSLLAVALDAGLNPVFIFGLGGLPSWGVAGSALATVAAQAIVLFVLAGSLYLRRHFLRLHSGEIAIQTGDSRMARDLLKQAGPMGAESLLGAVLAVLMIPMINRFGSDVTAAYGVAVQLWGYVMMPSMAIVVAITTMAAQSIGAKRWGRVRDMTRLGLTYSLGVTAILFGLLEVLNGRAFAPFLPLGSPALAVAGQINRVASCSCIAFAGYGSLLSAPRAAGAVWVPLALSATTLGARVPIAALLLHFRGVAGIWWSFPLSGILAGLAATLYYVGGTWRTAEFERVSR